MWWKDRSWHRKLQSVTQCAVHATTRRPTVPSSQWNPYRCIREVIFSRRFALFTACEISPASPTGCSDVANQLYHHHQHRRRRCVLIILKLYPQDDFWHPSSWAGVAFSPAVVWWQPNYRANLSATISCRRVARCRRLMSLEGFFIDCTVISRVQLDTTTTASSTEHAARRIETPLVLALGRSLSRDTVLPKICH